MRARDPRPFTITSNSPTHSSTLRKIKVQFVVKMARRQAFRDNPELQQFVLPEARPTGKRLGVGSYGSVEELQVKGLVCAGKRLHEALLERDNEGVMNIERKYLEECQVKPTYQSHVARPPGVSGYATLFNASKYCSEVHCFATCN